MRRSYLVHNRRWRHANKGKRGEEAREHTRALLSLTHIHIQKKLVYSKFHRNRKRDGTMNTKIWKEEEVEKKKKARGSYFAKRCIYTKDERKAGTKVTSPHNDHPYVKAEEEEWEHHAKKKKDGTRSLGVKEGITVTRERKEETTWNSATMHERKGLKQARRSKLKNGSFKQTVAGNSNNIS